MIDIINKLSVGQCFFIGIALGLGVAGFVSGNLQSILFALLVLILVHLNAISKKMVGTVVNKWANTNIVWEANPELAGMLYKLIVRTKKEQVVVRILNDDFNKVEIGDTVEIVEKKELSLFTRYTNFPYYEFVRKLN